MIETMLDLKVGNLPNGNLRIKQSGGEQDVIELHPIQIRLLAERAGLLRHEPDAGRVPDLERRLGVLAVKLMDFACDTYTRNEIIERCGSGFEILAKLDGIVDLAVEYGYGGLTPEILQDQEQPEAPASEATSKPAQTA